MKFILILFFEVLLPLIYLVILIVLWIQFEIIKSKNKENEVISVGLLLAISLYVAMIEDILIWGSVLKMISKKTEDKIIIEKILEPKNRAIKIDGDMETKM